MTQSDRMKILSMLEEGKISAAEAERLLLALGRSESAAPDLSGLGRTLAGVLDRVGEVVDRIPEKVNAEHLARVGKGVGRVVDTLTDLMDQGLSLLDSGKYETFTFHEGHSHTDLDGVTQIQIENAAGRVTLQAEERSDVQVDVAAAIRAGAAGAAEEIHRSNPVIFRREGGTLFLAPPALLHEGLRSLLGRNRYDFVVRVPASAGFTPQISTLGGDILLSDLRFHGRARIKAVSGEVRVHRCDGDLDISTVSGAVSIESSQGALRIRSVSGEIALDSASGPGAELATVSGDIRIEGHLAGPVAIKTVSGDIEARVLTRGRFQATSTSGDVELELQAGSAGYLDASSRSGDVEVDLPLEDAAMAKRHVKGRYEGGTEAITLSSISGDVLVRKSEA